MAQAVSLRHITTEDRVLFRPRPCDTWGRQSFPPFAPGSAAFCLSFHQCSILILIFLSLIRRTRGRSLGTLKQRFALPDNGQHWTEKDFYDFLGAGGGELFGGWSPFFSVSHVLHIPAVSYCFVQPNETDEPCLYLAVCFCHLCQVGCLSSRRRLRLQVDLTASR